MNSFYGSGDWVAKLKRTVLFVIGDLDVGGAERHLAQILPELAKQGFQPMVYALTHKGRLAPRLEAAGVEVVTAPFSDLLRRLPFPLRPLVLLPMTMLRLWSLMLFRGPRVVHFFLPAAYLLGGICSLFAPSAVRVMSRRSLNNYQQKHPYLAPLERWLHRRMDAVLGNSAAVLGQLREEGVPAARLGLIYNGIRLSEGIGRAEARRRLGIGNETLVFVIVANLIPYKGHMDLVDALGEIRERLPEDWVLLCAGRDTGIGRDLDVRAQNLGIGARVRWMGERSDVLEIFSAADVGILCSHQEGFSNSLLEGMASGTPMVVTDVGGNREAVVDGESGFVVPPRQPEALSRALLRLADDATLRQQFGGAAHRRVSKEFSLAVCVHRYAMLYEALMDRVSLPISEILARSAVDPEPGAAISPSR